MADRERIVPDHALWATWLGEAYLAAGRIADARRTVSGCRWREPSRSRSAAIARTRYAPWARSRRSEEPPDAEEAERCYREALALAEELEMRPLQAHCHLGLGKLYRRVGRVDEARAELATAVAMLREMGMAFWLPEAEAELAQADGSAQSTVG